MAGQLFPELVPFAKGLIAIVGAMLVLILAGTVDRDEEERIDRGEAKFDALRMNCAEFFAFFLFSMTGLMLVASANDLIWLFLALELTSLPTYIMVVISGRRKNQARAQEAGVKYFFLGALGAAVFLYGFAMLYGATGTTDLAEIAVSLREQSLSGGINAIGIAGLVISIIGLGFKIAAVPMHFYTPDVYQGASSSVSAMLAFVPKTAGFIAIVLILGATGWMSGRNDPGLPTELYTTLWIMAAATMTVGNVMAILQNSVKRLLAYSSIAHSGYMLCGVIAGPGIVAGSMGAGSANFWENGVAAVLFYLLCYGVMNAGTFAVLACFERNRGGDIDDIDDLRGLLRSHPVLGVAMLLCVLSLMGLPPLLGFWGKLGLFTAIISSGEYALAIVLALNSAIAAFYYLRLAAAVYLDPRDEERTADLTFTPFITRPLAAVISAGGVVVLSLFAQTLIEGSLKAASYRAPSGAVAEGEAERVTADAGLVELP
ncbi:MAG: NADH-quinone oxidoreductase subunit N [Phycisphaerae bacterium]|nr:NADH-quinone oxidoreductase subunit N [Phycisphaerae bacterium]